MSLKIISYTDVRNYTFAIHYSHFPKELTPYRSNTRMPDIALYIGYFFIEW